MVEDINPSCDKLKSSRNFMWCALHKVKQIPEISFRRFESVIKAGQETRYMLLPLLQCGASKCLKLESVAKLLDWIDLIPSCRKKIKDAIGVVAEDLFHSFVLSEIRTSSSRAKILAARHQRVRERKRDCIREVCVRERENVRERSV